MSDNLPGEVLTDILARVPAEDLVRCTAVCKPWNSLIKSPDFISLHLKRPLEDKSRNYLLLRYYDDCIFQEYYSLHVDNSTCDEFKRLDFPFATTDGNPYFIIVGSCNGLICISDDLFAYRHEMFIWNPSIRKAVYLPKPNITYGSRGSVWHSYGFGFDSFTNDYKVVKITHVDRSTVPPEVEVYSLNTGYWRTISSDKAPPYVVEEQSRAAYVHGALHWLAGTSGWIEERQNLILSFDVKDERFQEISVPESLLHLRDYRDVLHISACKESIALFHQSADNKLCTMWVMKEYGVPESWVKQFTLHLGAGVHLDTKFGIRPNGEVWFSGDYGSLHSYDYKKETVSIPLFRRMKAGVYVTTYTDSLVLLGKGRENYDVVVGKINANRR